MTSSDHTWGILYSLGLEPQADEMAYRHGSSGMAFASVAECSAWTIGAMARNTSGSPPI